MADFAELGIKVTSTGAGKAQTDFSVQSVLKRQKNLFSVYKNISNLKSLLAIGVGGATITRLFKWLTK